MFFGTFMLHMMPEVREILEHALIKPNEMEYPFAEFLMATGFFVVLLIEKFALSVHAKVQDHKAKKCQDCPFVAAQCGEEECIPNANGKKSVEVVDVADLRSKMPNVTEEPCDCEENGCESETKKFNSCDPQIIAEEKREPEPELQEDQGDVSHHASRSLVLVIALSLHRIFEGMSIGLKYTTLGVWNLCIAILCHETVIGFSLGLQFVRNRFSDKRNLIYCCLVSLIMPLGVAIGTLLVETGGKGTNITLDIVNGVLQSISTGTFIYVTFFEILQDEITHADHDMGKVLSLIVGFGVMAALSIIPEPTEVLPVIPNGNSSLHLTTPGV